MVWGRNDLSLFVEQESDNSLSLKLLFCLEMALCGEWFELSVELVQSLLLCHRCQAVQLHANDTAFVSYQFVQALSFAAEHLCLQSSPVYHPAAHPGICMCAPLLLSPLFCPIIVLEGLNCTVNLWLKSSNTLRQNLVHAKDKTPRHKQSNVDFVQCQEDCKKLHTVETKQLLHKKMVQERRAISLGQ